MKIIISATADFPEGRGGTPRIRNIARGLRERGAEVTVLLNHAAGYVGRGQNHMVRGEIFGVHYEYLNGSVDRPESEAKVLRAKLAGGFRLWWRLIRSKPDAVIIYNHTLIETGLMILTARVMGTKVIFDVCDERFDTFAMGHQQSILRRLNSVHYQISDRLLYLVASGFFVVSEYLHGKVQRLSNSQPVLFVPLVADIPASEHAETVTIERSTIVYMGSIIPDEGLETLIDAVRYLRDSGIDVHCSIIGGFNNSSYKTLLTERIREAGLQSEVRFLGPQPFETLHRTLQQADLLALPRPDSVISKAGFPGKLSEYLRSARPVVATNFGDIARYFDNTTMFISSDTTAESYVETIRMALADMGRRDSIGRNGKERGTRLFHYQNVCKQIMAFIQKEL